jgi:eukaryotic-like serine/threonine-protein kinase
MPICLTVIEGPHQGDVFSFGGHDTFLVGRSKHAHFRLSHKDKYFSRVHFLLEVNPPRCRLIDMGSRNGTFVNGQKAATADLKDGDLITAGHSVLRVAVVPDSAGDTPPPNSQATPLAAAAVPQPVQGYQVLRELGRGGLGIVCLARRAVDDALVALKIVTPAVAASAAHIERFLASASVLRQLDHPNIVRCVDLGASNGRLFFAAEYVQGTDAAELVKKNGPLPVPTAVGMVCQLLKALEYGHARQVVHRDVKPSNLLVAINDQGGAVKVADFGVARVYQASQLSGLTMTGGASNLAGFMPPEQITQYRDAKPAADQYAAAATLYHLLTGHHVYDLPREVHRQFALILGQEPVSIRTRRADVPEALAAVIHKALAREPQDRFADVTEFRRALRSP